MGFWQTFKSFFTAPGSVSSAGQDAHGVFYHFRCDRCGSVVRVRADRRNDFNRFDAGVGPTTLLLRKDVMDDKCYQLMRAEIWVDGSYAPVSTTVSGGKLISEQEYLETVSPSQEQQTPTA